MILYKFLLRMKNFHIFCTILSNKMFTLAFSISLVCLVAILRILSVIPLLDFATAHLLSGKEVNPSSQESARFSGRYTLA